MKKIIVFTQTYNSEKTLCRCMDSVINQSYENIVYYVADNNSSDGTRAMIEEYRERDSRVVPVFAGDNKDWQIYSCFPDIVKTYGTDGYFIVLDADDEYLPSCFERLVDFLDEHDLDVAACTSNFVDGITNAERNQSTLENHILVTNGDFERLFPQYFRFTRDSWGKLFSLKLFQGMNFAAYDHTILSGSVSVLAVDASLRAERFGVLAERLHQYYLYPNSLARSFTYKKVITPMLYAHYKNSLLEKCGRISADNLEFFFDSYFRALKSKIPVILEAHVDVIEKLRSFHYILSSEITRELFAFNILPLEKQGYLSAVLHWLDAQPLAVEPEGRLLADEIRVMGEDFLIQANGERA